MEPVYIQDLTRSLDSEKYAPDKPELTLITISFALSLK